MSDLIAQIKAAQRDTGERAVIAHLEATMSALSFNANALPEAEPDVADIIAGALQTSRGHAYELMQAALDARDA
jgi:hypothetical protein